MYEDIAAVNLLFNMAVEDIRQGRVKPGDKIQQIKELKASNNKIKVLYNKQIILNFLPVIFNNVLFVRLIICKFTTL